VTIDYCDVTSSYLYVMSFFCLVQLSYLFFLFLRLSAIMVSARINGGTGNSPHCGCGPHVIHGVEVSALSAPRCRPPLLFLCSTTDYGK